LPRIPVVPLHKEVADRIRHMIQKGLLKEGDRIVENRLCEEMGVSRTPLREALRILNSEGLIDLAPNKGAYVAKPSLEEIREMFHVMSILEGACARAATERMTETDFQKIEKLHEKLEQHHKMRDHEKYLKVNQRYHSLIQELAGNKTLNEVIIGLRQKILLYRYRQLYQPERFDKSMAEHRVILEAFRRRDPAAAEEAMKTHLMNQCKALLDLYAGARGGEGEESQQ